MLTLMSCPPRNGRIRMIGILFCLVMTPGCARFVSLDYQPTNSLKGQGVVEVAPFLYQAFEDHHVRSHQVETNPSAKTDLFLTRDIGTFFADALRLELIRSGYQVQDSSERVVSGTISRFYLDWRSGVDRSFELHTVYTVRLGDRAMFTWNCSSIQKGLNMLAEDGILLRKGTADCMQRFIQAAQEEKVF